VTGVRELVALAIPGGPAFVEAVQRAWDRGDAVLPIDARLPEPAVRQLFDALAPTRLVDALGDDRPLTGGRPVEDGDAVVVATSGSTGAPKGVVHTHESVTASAASSSARLQVDPDRDRWLACLPLAHIGGLSVVLRSLLTGTAVEVHDGFDAAAVEDAARRGATLVSVVPTALERIDASLFRALVVGGAAPPDVLPANAVTSYGMTETGSACVYDGWPLDRVEVRATSSGELQVRGPMLLRTYRDGTDPKDADGWFATADAGAVESDGRVVVHGRVDDAIVTGGEKVWPIPVERVLGAMPGIAEVAVIGRPDAEWGERVVAIVVPVDRSKVPSLAELRDAVRGQLPAYAAPRDLELVDALPRTTLGKVVRHAL
jgi:O-succinylbenzoic acid--CoA ligase